MTAETAPAPPQAKKPFTVTIIGGGIGGLALAIGLLHRRVPVRIYEAASEFSDVGLGLTIGPAAHRILPLIDPKLRDTYDAHVTTHADSPGYEAFKQTWFEILWATGPHAGELLMNLKAEPSGQTTVRRSDFLDGLVRAVPADVVHFGKRLEACEEDEAGGVHLRFADGTTAVADVVVGCDGIRSRVKETILPAGEVGLVQPRYSGMYGYRAVFDMDTLVAAVGERRARVASIYVGSGAYAISYPIMHAKQVNMGIYVARDEWTHDAWVRPADREEMLRDVGFMGEHVNAWLEHMDDASQWAIFEMPAISTFCKSRVAILGDAAHASTPHQGAGAGQAIEDAHVLAELLADPAVSSAPADLAAAFRAYDAVRRPRSQRVVRESRENASLFALSFPGVMDDGDKLRAVWSERFRWLWDIDVVEQVECARRLMHGYLGKG